MIRYDTPADRMQALGEVDCRNEKKDSKDDQDGCTHCCRFHGGFVLPNETTRIAKHLKIDEEKFKERYLDTYTEFNTTIYRFKKKTEKEKPFGPCTFLARKGCEIHQVKPLHCRIGTCKEGSEQHALWFKLNYLLNTQDPQSMRDYAMYLKTGGKTLPGAQLHELMPDKEKLDKLLRYERYEE